MTLPVTASLATFFLALTVLFGWRGARASRPHAPPRLIPWRFLMLVAFTAMIAMLVHLVALIRDPVSVVP
jgi:hypothetical protein